jgi:hypothetical protein
MKRPNKRLSLNKTSVRALTSGELIEVNGGGMIDASKFVPTHCGPATTCA